MLNKMTLLLFLSLLAPVNLGYHRVNFVSSKSASILIKFNTMTNYTMLNKMMLLLLSNLLTLKKNLLIQELFSTPSMYAERSSSRMASCYVIV